MLRTPSSVVVRCDGGAVAGIGHVSRCLTLADAFGARNIPVRFITATGSGMTGAAMVTRRGFTATAAAGPLCTREDTRAFRAMLEAEDDPLAVIDSREANAAYLEAIGRHAVTMCIHDFGGAAPPAHIVLNANLDAAYHGDGSGQLRLLGPCYNLVRPAFFAAAGVKAERPRIVITFGGEDPHNHTLWVLTELGGVLAGHAVDVIVGPAHPAPASVNAAATGMPNVRVVTDPPDMATYLVGAALAITAGGTTCYELAAAGVPQAGIVIEEHQRPLVERMVAEGAMVSLGDYRVLDNEAARATMHRLLGDEGARARLAAAGRKLLPGPGAPRVVEAVLARFDAAKRTSSETVR